MGLSQDAAADLIGANRSTFKTWDRDDRRPRDPEMIQAISEALKTPIDVLWPPDNNPHVARSLSALREQRAHEAAEAETLAPPTDPEPRKTPELAPAAVRVSSVPDPRDVLRTLDGEDRCGFSKVRRPRRRIAVPAALSVVAALAAGTAIATAGGDDTATTRAAAMTGPTPAQRERGTQRAALAQAQQRNDYDAAILLATELGDTKALTDLRAAASEVLTRRARTAAERGDLALATARMTKAEKRYGPSSAIAIVERRIDAIKRARTERAAQRRAAAKKRVAAKARAAAAAARAPSSPAAAPTPQTTTPQSNSTPTPAPAPTPAPSPAPGPSSGGSGGGSEKTVDPGIF